MQRLTRVILVVLIALLPLSVQAQKAKGKKVPLPRVLIIGDLMYNQTSRSVSTELKGKAAVSFATWPDEKVHNSTVAVEHLDQLLGRKDRNGKDLPKDRWPKWDLIHVNVGLGDLIYRAPNMKAFRVMPIHAGGVITTSPELYEANLNALIPALKKTGAVVVWARTTPIRHSTTNVFKLGTEIEYNKIADRVAKRHDVPINDMYSYVKSVINMDKPAGHGADPWNTDRKPIHGPVVEIIARELKIELPKKPEPKKPTKKKGSKA